MTTIRPVDPAAVEQRTAALVAEHRALEAAGSLARAGTDLRHRLDEVPGVEDDPAWAAYAAAADAAVAHLQIELVLAAARLSSQRAVDPDEVQQAIETASHLARQRLEELRVQVHLGEMDVTAAAERAVEQLEHLVRSARERTRRLQHVTTHSLDELRRSAGDAIHGAHRGLMAVASAASSGDFGFEEKQDRP